MASVESEAHKGGRVGKSVPHGGGKSGGRRGERGGQGHAGGREGVEGETRDGCGGDGAGEDAGGFTERAGEGAGPLH